MRKQKGFTLIELMISITLVAALATGMMMAMRTSLLSLEKINARLQFNRRVMGMDRVLTRQIGGVMPVLSNCGEMQRVAMFKGSSDALRLVTSYSMAEGARGYPQFDEFQVIKGDVGLRLIVTEHLFTGPSSTVPYCGELLLTPPQGVATSMILADRLATCTFSYRERIPDMPPSEKWLPVWTKDDLPAAVKIEMSALDSSAGVLPVVNVTVQIRVTKEVKGVYEDLK